MAGPDAILLVLPISSRLGQEEWAAMEAQLRLLETPIWQRAVILFTHGDRLGPLSIQEYVRRQGGTLQWLLERCQNRYQVLSSLCSTAQLQVRQLIKKVQMIAEASRTITKIYYRVNIQLGDLSLGGTRSLQEPELMGKEYDGAGPRQTGFTAASGAALSLILLGRRNSGKSSAGNMILGREEFLTDIQTVCCSAGHADVSGRSVTVVDTPGWSLFAQADPEEVQREILKSPSLCAAGSKVMVLLAIPVDSFREKDRKAAETYVRLLGERIWSSTVVLFTYGDALWRKTMQDHIKEKGPPLEWILDKCEHRFHVCDTNSTDPDQVTRLLQMVQSA
ncbi:PREDICTED: GTPase IMAP family member 8-like [Cyprinodon variegatus]|uniref:GTPase IMAP family member 8-like n=1 Tax=Cyprinodon variegatus TaxID=28743 RepID=UPI0007427FA1|nr:PREDICTED: GTPase IMAP family member 8-like [Cyprinodon variegatus]